MLNSKPYLIPSSEFQKPRNLLTLKLFCHQYSVGRTFTYQLLADGKLTALKVGDRTLIPRESAEAWQASLPRFQVKQSGN